MAPYINRKQLHGGQIKKLLDTKGLDSYVPPKVAIDGEEVPVVNLEVTLSQNPFALECLLEILSNKHAEDFSDKLKDLSGKGVIFHTKDEAQVIDNLRQETVLVNLFCHINHHWVACVIHNKALYSFDSFNNSLRARIGELQRRKFADIPSQIGQMYDNKCRELLDARGEEFRRRCDIFDPEPDLVKKIHTYVKTSCYEEIWDEIFNKFDDLGSLPDDKNKKEDLRRYILDINNNFHKSYNADDQRSVNELKKEAEEMAAECKAAKTGIQASINTRYHREPQYKKSVDQKILRELYESFALPQDLVTDVEGPTVDSGQRPKIQQPPSKREDPTVEGDQRFRSIIQLAVILVLGIGLGIAYAFLGPSYNMLICVAASLAVLIFTEACTNSPELKVRDMPERESAQITVSGSANAIDSSKDKVNSFIECIWDRFTLNEPLIEQTDQQTDGFSCGYHTACNLAKCTDLLSKGDEIVHDAFHTAGTFQLAEMQKILDPVLLLADGAANEDTAQKGPTRVISDSDLLYN